MNAKRALETDWKFKVASGTSVNICQSKVGRGQLGPYTHELCLKDLAKNCSRKVLLVNDFIRGGGEVGVASVAAKVSEEAVGNNCNVCYWGFDFRPTFAEVSKARIKTELGRHYLNGQLTVQAPADPGPQGMAKKDIQTLLPQQLKHLSIDADGDIVLPSLDNLPVQPNQALREALGAWAREFPQKSTTTGEGQSASGDLATGEGTLPGTGDGTTGTTDQLLAPRYISSFY